MAKAARSGPSHPQGTRQEATAISTVVIRPATPGDFPAVARLLAELGRPEVTPETEGAARAVYLRHLDRPDTASLVAEKDGRIVGFMSLEFRERLNQLRPQAWIPDIIVTAEARGQGIGKALLLRGIELARQRGCASLVLDSGYQRQVAHRLYKAVGMRDEGYYFVLRLEGW